MKQITREWLAFLREQYPVGSRIRLNSMEDPYAPVEPGTMGTLQRIDDAGQFLMKWDNGRTLSLIPGEDSFSLILPEPTMMKLYMPLHADLYTKDDWSDTSEEPEMLTGRALMEYEDSILIALIKNRMSEEAERGIMRWYGREDSVDRKVKSVVFTAEEREGQLWGVAECKVVGELTPEELDTLKDYISGQASDGWGEGFEQREIQVDDGELYVHLWNFGDWSIQTEEECFSPKLAEGLPDMCFSTLKSTGDLICIKRGESGYYPSDWNTADKARNEDMADELNGKLGVTSAQRQAMEVGSMAGWNVPGANPAAYVVMLLGNHEYMMLDALYNIPDEEDGYADYLREKRLNLWYRNGGDVTHRYLKHIRKSVRQEILEYLDKLPVNIEIMVNGQKYLLTHAAPEDEYLNSSMKHRDGREFAVWHRYRSHDRGPDDYTVIFGHTPTTEHQLAKPATIWNGRNLIDIDCGAAYEEIDVWGIVIKTRLACLRLDDMKEFYSEEDLNEEGNQRR